ncbi:hypothetical protein [Bacillus alkalicellulosilyticus]|uniref:hypothetical protein n=1 Tax=Alkalihalobacterium alkalicellulosilyticum TaxID=1912214 RepID=UPI001BB07ADB|nr:hypothetical protein [Bacillus alkalicellulosilyticus]
MKTYDITNMIVDENFGVEEYVTAELMYEDEQYSLTFNKSDLELVNMWIFKNGTSLPANLSDEIIESIRADLEARVYPNEKSDITMEDNEKKRQKTVFKDNQDLVPEGTLPLGREDRSDKMGSLNSEEIRFKNADDIYNEYQ